MQSYKIHTIDLSYYICGMLCIWLIFPVVYRELNHILIIALFLLWLVAALISHHKFIFDKSIIVLILYLLFITAYKLLGISDAVNVRYYQQFFFWISFIFYKYYDRYGDEYRNKKFANFLLAASFISFSWNVAIFVINPAIRWIPVDNLDVFIIERNIGETPYSYYAALMFILALYLYRRGNSLTEKIRYIALMAVSIILVFMMARTITVICILVCIASYEFLKKVAGKKLGTKLFWLIVVFAVIASAYFLFGYFVTFITNMVGDGRIIDRLNEMKYLLYHEKSYDFEGSGTARLEYFMVSINTWLDSAKNFYVGIGYPDMNVASNWQYVGSHSEIIDTLAKYGIIGEILFLWAFILVFKDLASKQTGMNRIFMGAVFLMLIVYGILSRFLETSVIGIGLFMAIPFALKSYTSEGGPARKIIMGNTKGDKER